jgi:hypothetical protein
MEPIQPAHPENHRRDGHTVRRPAGVPKRRWGGPPYSGVFRWSGGGRACRAGEVGDQAIEVSVGPRRVGRIEPIEQLVLRQPAIGMGITERGGDPVAVGVGGTHLGPVDHPLSIPDRAPASIGDSPERCPGPPSGSIPRIAVRPHAKQRLRALWPVRVREVGHSAGGKGASSTSCGAYAAVAADLVSDLGPRLVEAAGIRSGDRVLDVAAGTGNATIPAALAGASVVGIDLSPE